MEINSNSPNPNATPTPTGLGNVQRPGEFLRQIRLSQNKQLSDVAQELKISEKQLIALESDDYKALPEAPFIKGYYRAYAKFLNTDAASLIQRFDEIYKNDTGLPPNHALKDSPIKTMGRLASSGRRGMNKWVKRVIILIAVIAVIWALWAVLSHWMDKKDSTEEVRNTDQSVEIVAHDTSNPASMAGDQLQLEFSTPTSVMIVDATGKMLAQGRQSSALTLQGQAPFSIRIDDASAVKLKLNHENISLGSYTNSSGSADFRLSP
ncbi:DUF4115 domain-containing protein [Acinetobacter qingfengensis]|uniref:DNA-binding protein n=1 Tax=Acinetobacter qingfengensis TaxID=1262585 RepID=A0A1E7R1C3_9GAMM|nr:helix-turn-helix domain-containing protein [Acinetobacter qingfengensis]KAA8733259.1 DUF4115 domain-containing protein [Acinetobacter qingfengensis]OEY93108.1 DNA-binding protein [Acinetobacter qingfengensis]